MAEPPAKKARVEDDDDFDDDDDDEDFESEDSSDSDFGDSHVTLTFGDPDAATAAVIWMHGLGDTPAGWAELASTIQGSLPHTKWILPCAPENPVSCNGGMSMTSWMDLLEIPITPQTGDNGLHLPESMTMIHKFIDELIEGGMPANRIVLGGFSQGGALALAATLKYPKPLGGACVLSGWCLKNLDVPSLAKSSPNKKTPFLVCHGDADQTVTFSCGKAVRKALDDAGTPVEFHSYPGMAHSSCPEEEGHITAFIKRVVK